MSVGVRSTEAELQLAVWDHCILGTPEFTADVAERGGGFDCRSWDRTNDDRLLGRMGDLVHPGCPSPHPPPRKWCLAGYVDWQFLTQNDDDPNHEVP
jgi:hypothetical protein